MFANFADIRGVILLHSVAIAGGAHRRSGNYDFRQQQFGHSSGVGDGGRGFHQRNVPGHCQDDFQLRKRGDNGLLQREFGNCNGEPHGSLGIRHGRFVQPHDSWLECFQHMHSDP